MYRWKRLWCEWVLAFSINKSHGAAIARAKATAAESATFGRDAVLDQHFHPKSQRLGHASDATTKTPRTSN
jgi:hypothetical protein